MARSVDPDGCFSLSSESMVLGVPTGSGNVARAFRDVGDQPLARSSRILLSRDRAYQAWQDKRYHDPGMSQVCHFFRALERSSAAAGMRMRAANAYEGSRIEAKIRSSSAGLIARM